MVATYWKWMVNVFQLLSQFTYERKSGSTIKISPHLSKVIIRIKAVPFLWTTVYICMNQYKIRCSALVILL